MGVADNGESCFRFVGVADAASAAGDTVMHALARGL